MRASVTAGLAKLVDDVNQYAAAMYAATAKGTDAPRLARPAPKTTRTSPKVATASPRKCGPVARWWLDSATARSPNMVLATTARRHRSCELGGDVDGGGHGPGAAEGAVHERDDRVQMCAGHRADGEDDGDQRRRGGDGVLEAARCRCRAETVVARRSRTRPRRPPGAPCRGIPPAPGGPTWPVRP